MRAKYFAFFILNFAFFQRYHLSIFLIVLLSDKLEFYKKLFKTVWVYFLHTCKFLPKILHFFQNLFRVIAVFSGCFCQKLFYYMLFLFQRKCFFLSVSSVCHEPLHGCPHRHSVFYLIQNARLIINRNQCRMHINISHYWSWMHQNRI